jgi:hypothetical protein
MAITHPNAGHYPMDETPMDGTPAAPAAATGAFRRQG